MRFRLALLVLAALAAWFAAAATPALALNPPPTVGGPDDGATFTRGQPITFSAYDDAGDDTHVYVAISSSPNPEPYTGIIADEVWFGTLNGGPSWSVTWSHTSDHPAGTYYFQIYATDSPPGGCFYLSDCYHGAGVRTLTLIDAPSPPSLTYPSNGETFSSGSTIVFSAHDGSAGAHLTLSVSRSSDLNDSQQIVFGSAMSGGPGFSAQWTPPPKTSATTYYWRVQRDECAVDCTSEVRTLTIRA